MRPIVTDGVAWSVGRSVVLSQSWVVQKRLNRSRCRSDSGLGWAQETTYYMGLVPMRRGNFEGDVICTTNGWLKEQDQQLFYNGLRVLKKTPDQVHFSCRKTLLKSDERWCTYLVINCVRTFWKPLVVMLNGVKCKRSRATPKISPQNQLYVETVTTSVSYNFSYVSALAKCTSASGTKTSVKCCSSSVD